jgi:hypothetical protein
MMMLLEAEFPAWDIVAEPLDHYLVPAVIVRQSKKT